MASSVVNNKSRDGIRNGPSATPNNQQLFRRERSFVMQRPGQGSGNQHFQQRERSFIRDGNRVSIAGGSPQSAFIQQQSNQAIANNNGSGKMRNGSSSSASSSGKGGKPNMEIYRPPSVRIGAENGRGQHQSYYGDYQQYHPRLTKSRTSLELNNNSSKSSNKVVAIQFTPVIVPASAAAQQQQQPHQQPCGEMQNVSGHFALQRSKSSGSSLGLQQQKVPVPVADISSQTGSSSKGNNSIFGEAPDVSQFLESAQVLLKKIAADPDSASSRSVIDAVRILFNRAIESSRYASPVARYCAYVIEKESKETFRESLLNTCQESFQERDRLLRSASGSSQRWVAFINFLNEMYLRLKRLNLAAKARPGNNATRMTPERILLTLLAESCCATLKQPSVHSLQELECLFFVLTGIGRDVENDLPGKMAAIWNAIRDAFLDMNSLPGAAQRTLLQLVELRAAKWQLPATAVTYYYPSVSGTAY